MASRVGGSSSINERLLTAAREGNLAEIEQLLLDGADINHRDWLGVTALHFACWSNNPTAVRRLLQAGSDVNAPSSNQSTPLHFADNLEIIHELLEDNADINAKDATNQTALQKAELARKRDFDENGKNLGSFDKLEKLHQKIEVLNEYTIARNLPWSPERHVYHPRAVREAVEALHVAWGHKADGTNSHPESPLSTLPLELVFEIAGKVAAAEMNNKKNDIPRHPKSNLCSFPLENVYEIADKVAVTEMQPQIYKN